MFTEKCFPVNDNALDANLSFTVASEIAFRISLSHLSGARTVYASNHPHRVPSHALVYQAGYSYTVMQPGLYPTGLSARNGWGKKWLGQEMTVSMMTVVK